MEPQTSPAGTLPHAAPKSSLSPKMQILPLCSCAEVEARIAAIAERLYRDYADSRWVIPRLHFT